MAKGERKRITIEFAVRIQMYSQVCEVVDQFGEAPSDHATNHLRTVVAMTIKTFRFHLKFEMKVR